MINIVVVTHGDFAEGIKSSLEMVFGEADCVTTYVLREGAHPDEFRESIKSGIAELNEQPESTGTLVIVDLFGGTPSNTLAQIIRDMDPATIRCITGLNFPMLVEAVSNRNDYELVELEESCIAAGTQGIMSLSKMLSLA